MYTFTEVCAKNQTIHCVGVTEGYVVAADVLSVYHKNMSRRRASQVPVDV